MLLIRSDYDIPSGSDHLTFLTSTALQHYLAHYLEKQSGCLYKTNFHFSPYILCISSNFMVKYKCGNIPTLPSAHKAMGYEQMDY